MKIRVKAKVKEGYWHRDLVFHPSDESSIEYSCSCCGQSVCFASRYYPNCGAKMILEDK